MHNYTANNEDDDQALQRGIPIRNFVVFKKQKQVFLSTKLYTMILSTHRKQCKVLKLYMYTVPDVSNDDEINYLIL